MNTKERMSIQGPGNRMLTIRRPYSLFSQLMDDFYDDILMPGISREGYVMAPRVDLIDKDNYFVLEAELPGMDKKDLDIEICEDSVVIKGEKKMNQEHKEGKYYYRESTYGKFMRQVQLPDKINTEQVKANYENGMLKLELPKAESTKSRKIEL